MKRKREEEGCVRWKGEVEGRNGRSNEGDGIVTRCESNERRYKHVVRCVAQSCHK